jgi:hypothetical protein
MTIVDNPNQQMVWSLVAKGTDGPLCFSGGHPMRKSTSGHSPYTQTLLSKGTLVLLTASTKIIENADTMVAPNYSKIVRNNLWHLPGSEQGKNFEFKNRQKYGREELKPVIALSAETAEGYSNYFEENQGSACSWFYYPNQLKPVKKENIWCFEANQTFVAVIPLTENSELIAPPVEIRKSIQGSAKKFFADYNLISFPGEISGYIVETGEKSEYKTIDNFLTSIKNKTRIDASKLKSNLQLNYNSLYGDKLEMEYISEGLRCHAKINGKKQNWEKITKGAVYDSPFIKVKDGKLIISNGKEGYSFEFEKNVPDWREFNNKNRNR